MQYILIILMWFLLGAVIGSLLEKLVQSLCKNTKEGTPSVSHNKQSTAIAQITGSLDWWADRVKVDDFVNSELVDVLEGLSQQLRTLETVGVKILL